MEVLEKAVSPNLAHPAFSLGPVLESLSVYDGELIHKEIVFRLDKARIVLADHALLQNDFPQLRDQALLEAKPELRQRDPLAQAQSLNAAREAWLLEKAAYVSIPQAIQTNVNQPIPVRDIKVEAYRPFHYGRALIFSVAQINQDLGGGRDPREPGLLDVKGVGVGPGRQPSFASHSSGLLNLSEALREVIFQRLIDFILARNGIRCRTVPNYAVIDAGFDRFYDWGGSIPAGLLVRRAHRRPFYQWGIKDPFCKEVAIEREIELLLRRYGLTSTGSDTNLTFRSENQQLVVKYGEHQLAYSPDALSWIKELTGFNGERLELDGMNLQFTREVEQEHPEPQIIDFGAYWYKTAFKHPLVSLVACRPVRLGEIIAPDDPRFPQPDPQLMPPPAEWLKHRNSRFEDWGPSFNDAQDGATMTWALAFRDGRMSRAQLAEQLDAYLACVPGWREFFGHSSRSIPVCCSISARGSADETGPSPLTP